MSAHHRIADVFGRAKDLDDVATEWLARFKQHESKAIAEVFNFVLKCSGCDHKVNEHDVEDPDHIPEKLRDIQDEYQAVSTVPNSCDQIIDVAMQQNVSDYPIIARGKASVSFRDTMEGLFSSLIQELANTGYLYDQPEIMENIETWVGTMSSAGNRPFRHTATAVALGVVSELCQRAKEVVESSANHLRMSEKEKKKPRVNKGRVQELESVVKTNNTKREKLDEQINSWFETVFIHRYRDVDPRIRVDCVQALGQWISTYPEFFFDGTYLRYLGWVLSDTNAPTRLEVVKELQRLYKDTNKINGLKTFTERFRARMVEMATRDTEPNVRSASVQLLDTLREAGLLEPDDIDSVGRLIFDSEPRVRKSVVAFFSENINDLYEAKVDELGGSEALDEASHGVEDTDYDSPRLEWLKLKCLVELFQSYDAEDQDLPAQVERWPGGLGYSLIASGVESRFSIAAQSLYNSLPEIENWKVLAGYVLYDHSRPTRNGASQDAESLIKTSCQLDAQEEIILLEVLNAAVKMSLTETAEATAEKKGKRTKKEREELAERQEEEARHLAALIPRLLKKFGAQPEAASTVLRLEHVLNLEIFQELRQDSTTYAALLDDINKQFLTHGNESVLSEASRALLHARQFDDLGEITEGKVQALWQDTMDALHKLSRGKDVTVRGGLSNNVLTGLTNTVVRLASLASVSNCVEAFENSPSPSSARKGKGRARASNADEAARPAIDILIEMLGRGIPSSDTTPETDVLEDALVTNAAKAVLFYFIWKIKAWQGKISSNSSVPGDDVFAVAGREDAFIAGLTKILQKRKGADEVRLTIAGFLLDLFCAFVSLRNARKKGQATQQEDDWTALILEVNPSTQATLRELLAATERVFAKKSRKHLEEAVDEDDDPLSDDEDDDEPEDEPDDDDDARREQRLLAVLLAEQRLCELASKIVMGVLAGVVDGKEVPRKDGERGAGPMRKRLERNKARLGQNFKQVVEFLNMEKKGKGGAARSAKSAKGKTAETKEAPKTVDKAAAAPKSKEIIEMEDDEDDDEEMQDGEEEVEHEDADDPIEEVEDIGAAHDEVESVLGD